jgi:hypothetical protein
MPVASAPVTIWNKIFIHAVFSVLAISFCYLQHDVLPKILSAMKLLLLQHKLITFCGSTAFVKG